MPEKNFVERTALSAFTLDGRAVAKGQIVSVDPYQLNRLIDAGCVTKTDDENKRVLVGDFPTLQRLEITQDDDLRAARARAQDELDDIEARIAAARTKAAEDFTAIERQTTERLEAIGREVAEAQGRRDAALKGFDDDTSKAQSDRDAMLKGFDEEVSAARASADQAIAAEQARAVKKKPNES